jgi:hypothetical protein
MKNIEDRLGRVEFSPKGAVTAGQMMEWTLTYTAGSYGVDEGGILMLVQRIAADIQQPQFKLPDQPAYTTITTTGKCRLSYRYHKKQYKRPWQKWGLIIDVEDGSLYPGDTITIVLGDRSKGSPGIRAQTFVESKHEFRILLDPTNAAAPIRLPSSPIFPVIAGATETLVCLMPAQMMVGESKEIFVKGEDSWGNPTPCPLNPELSVRGEGWAEIIDGRLNATKTGVIFVEVRSGDIFCHSNPVKIVGEIPRYSRYWGDLHAQTDSTVGTGSEEEYFLFARGQARLDYTCHQGNDFQLTDEDWSRLNRVIKEHHRDHEFVIFPGYEWSGNSCAGGDHNVIYLHDDPPLLRSSHWQVPEVPENDMTPAHPADDLFEKLKRIGDVMVIPHVGGRHANVKKYFDPEIEHCVEILSCHGIFEWLLWDALEEGHQVGVVCNSDGHKGRPGAEGPGAGQFGIYGGLTCVLAKEQTREAIFNAIKARRCYGTTGARILLDFSIDGHLMGETFFADGRVTVLGRAHGTAPMEKLILMRGREIIHTVQPSQFNKTASSSRIRISWEGARIRGRARRATWDGIIRLDGVRLVQAETFGFDSPADGIVSQNDSKVVFKSSTVGDVDGIDLYLEDPAQGALSFESKIGTVTLNLDKLGQEEKIFNFGELDLMVKIQRYPEELDFTPLALDYTVDLQRGKTSPFLLKGVQEDGQIAWSSPIYITSRS